MVISCSAFGCTNRQGQKEGLLFYRVPADAERRAKWVSAVRRENWNPSSTSRICSEYFISVSGDSSSLLSEEQLLCSICLDVFTDPLSTPCGHNFCKSCLTQCWEKSQHCHCPLCKEKFTKKPELKINTTLREVADHFKKKRGPDKPEVLCDACTGEKLKALKSCLDCRATFCKTHFELHNLVSSFKKHKLINPVENLEDYICQKHERPLELFCRDDQTCVCQFCTETDHKNHNTVPIEEESGVRKTQLGKTQTDVQQMIQDRLKKIQEIKHSVELSKRSTEKEKAGSVEVFTALIRSIERSQAELLEVMEEKQKAAERQAEGLIKELEQEITVLKRRDTELEQLSHTEEHLHLLQIYSSMCSPPHTKNWTEISINTDLSGDTVRTALSQLQQTLNKKLTKTLNDKLKEAVSTELKRIQQYAVDVTLDPDTAQPYLILSADGKQVTHGDKRQNLPETPQRFDRYVMVLGKQSFSSGRFYYEVQVRGKTEWDLGVVRENINRKGTITLEPQNGLWTVVLRNENQYKACADPSVPLTLREKLETVGVFVDYEEGLVSFYDVKSRSHIYSFTGQSFTEKLYPYFSPGLNDGGKNSAPLIISPVLNTE
ncbi:E3 ubiquitin-protein ligase TRIM21-like [Neoarius graeffei]|uniref:E3 ubiquitin-protein ligase TRIM21-like n=1 Tax=Neoarius graeffei TaxID=443677 RepID=UPI00298CD5C1|nr:E3 ubiquitin-protein ligase TRIM21-like [Neoarius graeffei]XP_060789172.1 E3 ubiquitin-protein ligase TRIM21-like [Neoarius graeffei]